MRTSYGFNEMSAVKADRPSSINETGAYIVKILQAEIYDTKNGATQIRFVVKATEGAQAWIDLNIVKSNGDESFGMGILHTMLGLLGLSEVRPVNAQIRARDGSTINGKRLLDLERKDIGLFLQRENQFYTDKNGEEKEGYRMNIIRAFDPASGKTFSELNYSRPAQIIEGLKKTMKDKPAKRDGNGGGFESPSRGEVDSGDVPF